MIQIAEKGQCNLTNYRNREKLIIYSIAVKSHFSKKSQFFQIVIQEDWTYGTSIVTVIVEIKKENWVEEQRLNNNTIRKAV